MDIGIDWETTKLPGTSLQDASATSTRLCLAAIHFSSSTVEASYSCGIGLASNLAATVAIANPIHRANV